MRSRHRVVVVLALAGSLVGLSAGVASAHVTVSAPGAVAGGADQVITFRVPDESATASTTGLTVQLPTDTPIASVLVAPHTGWTAKVTSVQLKKPIETDDGDITSAVSTIQWTATSVANGIKPGEFDQFVIIAGLLPDVTSLTFKAIQHHSDNTDVAWVEVAAPGSAEPDHPAPTLTLAPAAGSSATPSATVTPAPTATTASTAGAAPTPTAAASSMLMADQDYAKQSGVTTALITSAIAVVLAAGALGAGFVAWRRTRP